MPAPRSRNVGPHVSAKSEPPPILERNTELDTITSGLYAARAILSSILRALTQHSACADILRALGQRSVEVTVQVTKLVETRKNGVEWPKYTALLAEALHETRMFVQAETERSSLYHVLLGRTVSQRYAVLENRLNSVLRGAEQYARRLEAGDLIAAAAEGACVDRTKTEVIKCGEMFSHAHDLVITGGTYYSGQIYIQNTSEQESCQLTTGIVPGVRVVALEDISLKREIHRNQHYRVHSTRNAGEARVVKVYRGPQGREHAQEAAIFNQKVMHPSILHMVAVSPLNSEVSFIIFDGGFEGSLEASLAKALQKDLRKSVILGLQTVVGLSSGLDYLQEVDYPFASAKLEHFSLFLSLEGEVVISFDPDIVHDPIGEGILERDDGLISYKAIQPLCIFDKLCQQTFDAACQAHYDGSQFERAYSDTLDELEIPSDEEAFIEELPSEIDESDVNPQESAPQNPSTPAKPVEVQRRELVWKPEDELDFSLENISREFRAFLDDLSSTSEAILGRRRGRYTARTAHRCTGYNRTEITLTPSITRSAIVTHSAPLPHEICPVCNQVVKDAEVFNCTCGQKDDGSLPTIQCSTCKEWHHRGCIDGLAPAARSFTCPECRSVQHDITIKRASSVNELSATAYPPSSPFNPPAYSSTNSRWWASAAEEKEELRRYQRARSAVDQTQAAAAQRILASPTTPFIPPLNTRFLSAEEEKARLRAAYERENP